MDIKGILERVDHTILNQTARWEDIKILCDDAIKYKVASVCIPASYVKEAGKYLKGMMPICTVIGFPNGYTTSPAKCFEAQDAINNMASEIDMVINIGWLKDKKHDLLLQEINAVKLACRGNILKVIIETCLLSDEEKIKICEIISESDADYIKTSTGFAGGGANLDDIILFKKHLAPHIKIKASGGIRSLEDAQKYIDLGVSRLGTSSIIKIVKESNLI